MSNNTKNVIKDAYMKNFTKKIKNRYVLFEKGKTVIKDKSAKFRMINSKVNKIIQDLNIIIPDRQLPYINLNCYYGNIIRGDKDKSSRIRMFVQNEYTDNFLEREVKTFVENNDSNSHILNILIKEEENQITISDLSYGAQIVIDEKDFVNTLIDILLDIIMFNSYSFLKELNIENKRLFSQQKYDLFIDKKLECFYEYSTSTGKLFYYCLAFSAHDSNGAFNKEKYIQLWKMMIDGFYPNKKHIEKSIAEQLKQHVDYGQLPANLGDRLAKNTKGAYLVLKINTDRTKNLHPLLFSLFGKDEYNRRKVLIKPISEIKKFEPLLKNLDISAFKVVVP